MQKFLIINADDFGYSVERNKGMVNCFLSGAISGVTLMVNGVAAEDAANRSKKVNIPTGMHFNIIEGTPVGTKTKTLTDGSGNFHDLFSLRRALSKSEVDMEEVRWELQSQIDRFQYLMGRKPTHIDGHQHAHILPGC